MGVVLGSELPAVDAPVSALRQQYSENDLTRSGLLGNNISLGLEASWEIDLFGRVRRSVEAAQADFQASQEDRADVMVALYSQVAQTYLVVRTLQARIAATKENIESQKGVLKLTQSRFKWGLATDLDVSQAQTVLGSSQAELPPLKSSLSQALNTLALLLGLPPQLPEPGANKAPAHSHASGQGGGGGAGRSVAPASGHTALRAPVGRGHRPHRGGHR